MRHRILDRVLIGGAMACAGIMLWSGPRNEPLSRWLMIVPFLGWVLLPFVLLHRLLQPASATQPVHWTTRAVAWLLAIGTPLLYGQAMFRPQHSTAALIFAFLPLYQLLLIGGVRLLRQWIDRPHTSP